MQRLGPGQTGPRFFYVRTSAAHGQLAGTLALQPAEALGRFHAKWHRDALLPTEPARLFDWTKRKTIGAVALRRYAERV